VVKRAPLPTDNTTMPFHPDEIESKRFLITFRGYDRDEVATFLRAVASDYRALKEALDERPDAPYELTLKRVATLLAAVEANVLNHVEAMEHRLTTASDGDRRG
jgi:DivIVA domain-containing protein